ncbi:MAG: hypothetical protein JST14_09615 [Bacteroidetes bacterium]|nr:hypothetical protein [Bacteroidota bacterium]
MKPLKIALVILVGAGVIALLSFRGPEKVLTNYKSIPKGCVYRTLMGEESSDSSFRYFTDVKVMRSLDHGLVWLMQAQHPDGGWGAGTHRRQDVMDPHAVQPDPATTAMVSMAILRSGSNLQSGPYASQLKRALGYLLETIEHSPSEASNITELTGTQIQTKLGSNIDVILASQFLSNMLDEQLGNDPQLRERVQRANNICVSKIQRFQESNGSFAGSGWAGVLQSSLATNALESAQAQGAPVDKKALDKSREFQKSNYNARTGDVNTAMGAGVMLYSVTGSVRASAKQARHAEEEIENARKSGKLGKDDAPTARNLEKIGFSPDEAMKYATAYEVYQSAKVKAQEDAVMNGFGSNGGEEFLSYLQTGESMVIGKDQEWKKWYENISGRMLHIQNDDGSWNGHHCITSPVFCTATCVLILSINQDTDKLVRLGESR